MPKGSAEDFQILASKEYGASYALLELAKELRLDRALYSRKEAFLRKKKNTRKRRVRKRRPGQPESSYKLDLRVRAKICESILEGLTLADAAALAGVSRQTVNEWRRREDEEPDSLYGEFSEAFELAKLQSKKGMIQKLLRHKDPRWTWKLMCNRWPEEFRDRVATEISGPNGVPLMPQNPFKVEIRLADSEEVQTEFEVEEPDGSISHVHYDPYGLEKQREARKQQKDATS